MAQDFGLMALWTYSKCSEQCPFGCRVPLLACPAVRSFWTKFFSLAISPLDSRRHHLPVPFVC
jgi:hypothetical protein